MRYVFKSTGTYLGFVTDNNVLYSRDGGYLGWLDGPHAWDASGKYRGQLWSEKYIITNRFGVQPLSRPPRPAPPFPALPVPVANIPPIGLPTGWGDAF
jgi:hypothetical protein